MADDKRKLGSRDRRTVAKGEGYEVSYFARKHNISSAQARDLIDRFGNDRQKLNSAASRLKSKLGSR